jgi:uncharacterized protein YozE (UPF0346 family)
MKSSAPNGEDSVGDLEDVFAAFMADHRKPSFDALCDYLQRHPRFARELIEFTVEWVILADLRPRSREAERAAERMAEDALAQLHALFSPAGRDQRNQTDN